MTTIVSKGTNRPAATARRKRHAQQGPKQAAAKAKAVEIKALSELLDLNTTGPWTPCNKGANKNCPRPIGHGGDHNKLTKAEAAQVVRTDLEEAVAEATPEEIEAAQEPEEKPKPKRVRKPRKTAAQKREEAADEEARAKLAAVEEAAARKRSKKATGPAVTGTTPVQRKANKFVTNAREAGWEAEIQFADGATVGVANKDGEFVRIPWHDGKIVAEDMPSVTFEDGRTVQMRNLAEVVRQLLDLDDATRPVARNLKVRVKKETPPPPEKAGPKPRATKKVKPVPEPETPAPAPPEDDIEPTLPFDAQSTDGEVYKAVVGKTVVFRPNGKNEKVELYVPKTARVEPHNNGGRMLRFANGQGEYTVRLDKIVRVK